MSDPVSPWDICKVGNHQHKWARETYPAGGNTHSRDGLQQRFLHGENVMYSMSINADYKIVTSRRHQEAPSAQQHTFAETFEQNEQNYGWVTPLR